MQLSRRQFLGAGAAGVTGVVLGGCAPGSTQTTPTSGASSSTTTTLSGPPDWNVLGSRLKGELIVAGDSTYPEAKLLYNEQFDALSPAAIAYCDTASDVQRCLEFAIGADVAFAARSGGHSYGGYSSSPGLIIDVSQLNAVALSADATSVRVGSGTRLIDLYAQTSAAGVCVPGGSCPSVGVAGLTLGGGIGVLDRLFGLTCDNVTSLTIVTADAMLRTVTPQTDGELFWALQGGGGGNFGIVTEFTYRTHPIPDIALFTLDWSWQATTSLLSNWHQWIINAPPALWANLQLSSGGTGPAGLGVKVTGVFAGELAVAQSQVQALIAMMATGGHAPVSTYVGSSPYLDAMLIEAGCEGLSVPACHLTSVRGGTLGRSAYRSKSGYIFENVFGTDEAASSVFVGAMTDLADSVAELGGGIVFDSYGGAIAAVAPGDSAFVHRQAISGIQYSFNFTPASATSLIADGQSWLERTHVGLAPYAQGAYVNYIDPTLEDYLDAYYGSNLHRLVATKRKYDPDDRFHFSQSIPVRL